MDITLIWTGIIGFAVVAYVVMDGFDLGIGILFPTLAEGTPRDRAMNSIAPFWDGNETWLVMGGGGLMAMFPLAYAVILPATYPLIIAMLLGLVFRGVAFEFRWRHAGHQAFWDRAFTVGSLVAALAQGMILGAVLQGIHVENGAYVGGWLDWLTPYTVLTGIGVAVGYALLGATWLIWKTDGPERAHARRLARRMTAATLIMLAAVSLATPFLQEDYWRRWFSFPNIFLSAPVPILVAGAAITLVRAIIRGDERLPFGMALSLFLLGFAGLAISLYPHLVPPGITIWDAAAPRSSQLFLLAGAVAIIPMILVYTGWAYWVFRGKADKSGYH